MATTKKDEKPGNIIMLALASGSGYVSTNFWLHDSIQSPMNTTMARAVVKGKPVDVARNELVKYARNAGAKYIFFIDDDVLVPHNALIRLFGLKTGVATGVYYTKTMPSTPVILKKDWPAGYEGWKYGDIIEVDYAGAGCLLVDMKVFDDIEEKFPDTPFFKYNRGRLDVEIERGYIGEDVWFCDLAAKCGHPTVCDTGVQCGHEDAGRGLIFKYDPRFGLGVWKQDGTNQINYLPTAEMAKQMEKEKEYVGGNVCWGYDESLEGYDEARVGTPDEIRGKFRDVESVKVRRYLEYRTNEEATGILRALATVMKPGADIEVRVPDVIKCIKDIGDESGVDEINDALGTSEGKYRGLYTKRFIGEAMKAAGFTDISVLKKGKKLVATARKGN